MPGPYYQNTNIRCHVNGCTFEPGPDKDGEQVKLYHHGFCREHAWTEFFKKKVPSLPDMDEKRRASYSGAEEIQKKVDRLCAGVYDSAGEVYIIAVKHALRMFNAVKIGTTGKKGCARPLGIVKTLRREGYECTFTYTCFSTHANILELAAHAYLQQLRVNLPSQISGKTEFFTVSCDEAMLALAHVDKIIVDEKARSRCRWSPTPQSA